jgi:hypothetical protein
MLMNASLQHGTVPAVEQDAADRLAIRDLVENWAVWRDARDWERFRTVWHQPGRMNATWFQGTADEFIAVSQAGFDRGVRILHFPRRLLGRCRRRPRDLADEDDDHAACRGRGRRMRRRLHRPLLRLRRTPRWAWGIVERQPIYEQDRLSPIDPATAPALDRGLLESFPVGYRHLAYLQTRIGYTVKPDMPGLTGPELHELYARGAAWLAG